MPQLHKDTIGEVVAIVAGAAVAGSGEVVGVVLRLATLVPPQAAGCIAYIKQLVELR